MFLSNLCRMFSFIPILAFWHMRNALKLSFFRVCPRIFENIHDFAWQFYWPDWNRVFVLSFRSNWYRTRSFPEDASCSETMYSIVWSLNASKKATTECSRWWYPKRTGGKVRLFGRSITAILNLILEQ